MFKDYFDDYTITETDFSIQIPHFEGYKIISATMTGADMEMPNISYVIRPDKNFNIEVQVPSSYVNHNLLVYLVYAKSAFF